MNAFDPKQWGKFLDPENMAAIVNAPAVQLSRLDRLYELEGHATAEYLVRKQMKTIYSLSPKRDGVDEATFNQAAMAFRARYGSECTPYKLVLYFAMYQSDFRSTLSAFDLADISAMYRVKFVPFWSQQQALYSGRKKEAKPQYDGSTGDDAARIYLRKRYATLDDALENCNLTKFGIWTPERLTEIWNNEKIF